MASRIFVLCIDRIGQCGCRLFEKSLRQSLLLFQMLDLISVGAADLLIDIQISKDIDQDRRHHDSQVSERKTIEKRLNDRSDDRSD